MKLSIVATLYRSALYVEEFVARVTEVAKTVSGNDFEIVLVNDGTPDNSLELAVEISKRNPHLVIVDLSRNFGHHQAMMAGLEQAKGEFVFLIDSDLEEDPELLNDFYQVMMQKSCDVVYGVQKRRKGNWFERWSGELYYMLFSLLTSIDHPKNICTIRLMSRRYVDALLLFEEREIVISCLWVITGFSQVSQPIQKRSKGRTSYNFTRKFSHLANAVTSFSAAPLRFTFYVGLIIFLVALVFTGYLIFNRLFLARPTDGWTSVMASVWLLGGMIISFIGLIGIYLSKVFVETKKRPQSIVKTIYGRQTGN